MRRNGLTWIILAVSLILIVTGIFVGNTHTVFVKAINICLECIGIG